MAAINKLAGLAAAVLSAAVLTSGCSIEEEGQEQLVREEDSLRELNFDDLSELQRSFMRSCLTCVMGDVSELDTITKDYTASRQDKDFPEPLALQQYRTNAVFESCAQKAAQLHHFEPLKAMVTRAGQAARISQRFYAQGKLTDGAFWLQRTLNINGEKNGYATAGRIFVQHRSTIEIGAKLLEQAARLGDHEAAQILLGLTDPSSSYYKNLKD